MEDHGGLWYRLAKSESHEVGDDKICAMEGIGSLRIYGKRCCIRGKRGRGCEGGWGVMKDLWERSYVGGRREKERGLGYKGRGGKVQLGGNGE
ncbi:hypothetical protein ACH5RR_001440 [Cinchona calisaya]|uniref:Uncharacterized protein n=1 Tax=Cinchona calisaya TaxID=153742 RepID=A0ABD3B3Q0_9GENT